MRKISNENREAENPEFSVLITSYYEEKSIDEFFSRLYETMESIDRSYEIIMVNDGSKDGTWQKLKEIWLKYSKVRVAMDFFQNSGQQAALTACMNEARGKAFIFMDSDLQLSPEEIPLLIEEYEKGYDVVSGYRKQRRDSVFRILPSIIANLIMRKASKSNFRDFGCTFKIYNAELIRGMDFGPFKLFSNVDAIARAGKTSEVAITHYPRKYGKSGWTFGKLWKYNMDNMVSLSERPFQWLAVGCFILAMSFVIRILLDYFMPFKILKTVTSGLLLNVAVISLLIIVSVMCLVGEFTIRVFLASRKHPQYIIREKLER